jgi:DNA-binding response OmpR family regulator
VNSLADYVNRLLRPSKILLVEDDCGICTIIAALAQRFNCELYVAPTVAAATKYLAKTKFDLVLLDYQLPDGNGLDIFRSIRSRSEETPVCIVTGYLTEELIEKIRTVGFCVFVQKPKDLTPKNLINIFLTFGIKPIPKDD